MSYVCERCGSTTFQKQMRKVSIELGENKELQTCGIMSVNACVEAGCDEFSAACKMVVGQLVPMEFTRAPQPLQKGPEGVGGPSGVPCGEAAALEALRAAADEEPAKVLEKAFGGSAPVPAKKPASKKKAPARKRKAKKKGKGKS